MLECLLIKLQTFSFPVNIAQFLKTVFFHKTTSVTASEIIDWINRLIFLKSKTD